ncbi:GDSL-type esterase/lipase family protein [Desulfolithobacter sp.]
MDTLLLIGDSLIEFGDWPALLPEVNVVNRGLAGETVEDLSVRIGNEVTSVEADAILIMCGTNNLLQGNHYFPAIYRSMLPRIQNLCPETKLTLTSMLPMALSCPARDDIVMVNQALESICREAGCHFLDLVEPFTQYCLPITKPCFLDDGVHLSTRGYRIWAREIAAHYRYLSQPSP